MTCPTPLLQCQTTTGIIFNVLMTQRSCHLLGNVYSNFRVRNVIPSRQIYDISLHFFTESRGCKCTVMITAALNAVQNTAVSVVLQSVRELPSQPLLQQLHWLPVRQRIDYKLAVLKYKIHHTSTSVYLSRHIQPLIVTRRLRSSATPRVSKPTTRTNFADRAFHCSAPAVWNSLTADIADSCSLPTFKRKLKTFLFRHAFSSS